MRNRGPESAVFAVRVFSVSLLSLSSGRVVSEREWLCVQGLSACLLACKFAARNVHVCPSADRSSRIVHIKKRERQTDRHRQRQRQRQREKERDRDRETERERETEQRDRETERDRQTERERERETDRQTETETECMPVNK